MKKKRKKKQKIIQDYYRLVSKEIDDVMKRIDSSTINKFISKLQMHKRIYIAGVGRSGLVVKAFGQRLMHLGFEVHLADEISAPAVTRGDLLICCSGTGNTRLTLFMARRAVTVGSYVVVFTANTASALARLSSLVVKLPSPLERSRTGRKRGTVQPARSLFEQVLYLLFDSIILKMIDVLNISPSKVTKRHTNLE